MCTDKSKSKKRARRDALEDDAAIEKKESRATKFAKKVSSNSTVTNESPGMEEHCDSAFPAKVVVDQESPAYLMALNYLKAYGSWLHHCY
jgi:hypothetical protein